MFGTNYGRGERKTQIAIRLSAGTLAKLDAIVAARKKAAKEAGQWWEANRTTRSVLVREVLEAAAAKQEAGKNGKTSKKAKTTKAAKRRAKPAAKGTAKRTKARAKRSS